MYKEFNKNSQIFMNSGQESIKYALKLLKSKYVAIPSYTCERVLRGVLDANCKPYIVDCGDDLQIDLDSLSKFKGDTVIVPHMFGIMVDIKPIKDMGFNIVEDCSQCLGLKGLGKYADYVVVSVGSSKWLSAGGGGFLIGDNFEGIDFTETIDFLERLPDSHTAYFADINYKVSHDEISKNLIERRYKASELINAGIDLIGKDRPNAWMRGMYFTDNQTRVPYIPIHELYGNFKCPNVDNFKNRLDWISIYG